MRSKLTKNRQNQFAANFVEKTKQTHRNESDGNSVWLVERDRKTERDRRGKNMNCEIGFIMVYNTKCNIVGVKCKGFGVDGVYFVVFVVAWCDGVCVFLAFLFYSVNASVG